MFLRTLGLNADGSHAVKNTAALVGFYFAAVALAFVLYALSSRRTGGLRRRVARKLSTEGRRR